MCCNWLLACFISVNLYKGKLDDDTVKEYYIHIDTVDSEYIKMGMPNRFDYIRDKHKLNLIPVSSHTGTVWDHIIFWGLHFGWNCIELYMNCTLPQDSYLYGTVLYCVVPYNYYHHVISMMYYGTVL